MTKRANYAMTEQQVEDLAAARTEGLKTCDNADATFLRVLITATQAVLGDKRGKRPATESQLEALEGIAVPFYAAVLRGVMTAEIMLDGIVEAAEVQQRTRERNRRATFARTAKSTLVSWTKEGGDIRALNTATVTKGELRAAVAAAREARGAEPAANAIARAEKSILAAAAREEPDKARGYLEAVISSLQAALDELGDGAADEVDPGESAVIRTRVGATTFTPARAGLLNKPS